MQFSSVHDMQIFISVHDDDVRIFIHSQSADFSVDSNSCMMCWFLSAQLGTRKLDQLRSPWKLHVSVCPFRIDPRQTECLRRTKIHSKMGYPYHLQKWAIHSEVWHRLFMRGGQDLLFLCSWSLSFAQSFVCSCLQLAGARVWCTRMPGNSK